MRSVMKKCQSLPRRTLSLIMAVSVFVSMFLAVLSGILFISASNPATVAALNRTTVVQEINLMPVEVQSGSRSFFADLGDGVDGTGYMEVDEKDDGTVDLNIIKTKPCETSTSGKDTNAYVQVYTKVGQMINLAENPWLMLRWNGNGRVNGRLYFTVTINGVTYGKDTVSSDKESTMDVITLPEGETFETIDPQTMMKNYCVPVTISNIVRKRHANASIDADAENDFDAGVPADYTEDLFEYFYNSFYKDKTATSFNNLVGVWPTDPSAWADSTKNYITLYGTSMIIASESNQDLVAGTTVTWEKFAIGREVLERPASILPRLQDYVRIRDASDVYTADGRVIQQEDGSITFSNTAESGDITFSWDSRNYVNMTELESLHFSAHVENMSLDLLSTNTHITLGGRVTTADKKISDAGKKFSYRGVTPSLSELRSLGSLSCTETATGFEEVIDIHRYFSTISDDKTHYSEAYAQFYPDDCLILVESVSIKVPPKGKVTLTQMEFQVADETMSATQANSVYPWSSDQKPNSLPPEGSAAVSSTLDGSGGVSYEWATSISEAPVVQTKVDLLSLKTVYFNKWDTTHLENNTTEGENPETDDVEFVRKSTGESVYSSKDQTDYSYYSLMRIGPSTSYDGNFYMYLDTNNTTPYLYYSYQLIDTDSDTSTEPSAGLYFHFANADRDTYTDGNGKTATARLYYLDQSGMTLRQCAGFFNHNYKFAAEAIMSSATARTGCIDISSLYTPQTGSLQLEEIRIYLAPGTDIQINYMFMGSDSLISDASGSVATQGNQAYPWAVDKKTFDDMTSPESATATFTFANKVDVLKDIQDRAKVNNQADDFPGATVNTDGSVTLKVTDTSNLNSAFKQESGFGFDHFWSVQVAANNDLSSVRYLNYSVSACAGMRWSIVLCENDGAGSQRAIMTWADAQGYRNGASDQTPAGNTTFRFVSGSDYTNYWKDKHDHAWRTYAIPGSQTGCIDLQQVISDFELDGNNGGVISVCLIAYQDPAVQFVGKDTASVTFNYVYLTSEPIEKSAIGSTVTTPGTMASWGGNAVSSPADKVTTKVNFTYEKDNVYSNLTIVDYAPNGITDGTYQADLTQTPYLYYSYRLIDPATGKTVTSDGTPLRVGMSIIENNTYYYMRNTGGGDSAGVTATTTDPQIGTVIGNNRGAGKPSFVRLSTGDVITGKMYDTPNYYVYGSETGCINLADYFINDNNILNRIRFYIPAEFASGYELKVDYLFLGTAATSHGSYTKYYLPTHAAAPTPDKLQNTLLSDDSTASGTVMFATSVKVDLSVTPYLFYSVSYDEGKKGTFALTTDVTVDNSDTFYRDASRAQGDLIVAGNGPSNALQYITSAETGCIDVKKWYEDREYTESIINISQIVFWGDAVNIQYFYFGSLADKNVDLIPEHAGGTLESGTPTAAWVVMTMGSNGELGQCGEVIATNDEYDAYNSATLGSSEPTTKLKFGGDNNRDNFNDFYYSNTAWSMNCICYGEITNSGSAGSFDYISTGNNQTAGLTVNLQETPYLHFSLSQADTSSTSMVLQTNSHYSSYDAAKKGYSANKVRPWLSAYYPHSSAGQLLCISDNSNAHAYYKDEVFSEPIFRIYGSFSGVIDLRSWYTQTNGYDNVISLERFRFYTTGIEGGSTVTVNHLYLSSSAGAAYTVEFDKNDGSGETFSQSVLINANAQYVSDAAVSSFKQRDGYIFTGWYLDKNGENFFDIANDPVVENMTLYAGWLDTTTIIDGGEADLLDFMVDDVVEMNKVTADKNGISFAASEEARELSFSVGKAFSLKQLRSLFVGFDLDKSCVGFDISAKVKSVGTTTFNLFSDVSPKTYASDKLLAAAPYDEELPLYIYMGTYNILPASDERYLLVDTLTVKIPAGVNVQLRYLKAAQNTSEVDASAVYAPSIIEPHDLLDSQRRADFYFKNDNVLYDEKGTRLSVDNTNVYYHASVASTKAGYIRLGGLYEYSVDVVGTNADNQYLFLCVTQNEGSKIAISLEAAFDGYYTYVHDKTVYTQVMENESPRDYKEVFYQNGTLVPRSLDNETEIIYTDETNIVCVINLKDIYKTALENTRGGSVTEEAKILAVRFYTSDETTEATVQYAVIGNGSSAGSSYNTGVDFDSATGGAADYYKNRETYFGDTVDITLDEIANVVSSDSSAFSDGYQAGDINPTYDATRKFLGWRFSQFMQDENTVLYWNPDAKNGAMYTSSNTDGAWSLEPVDGFVTNLKDVSFRFTNDFYTPLNAYLNTQYIAPVWEDAPYKPTLTVNVIGETAAQAVMAVNATSGGYAAPFTDQAMNYAEVLKLQVAEAYQANFVGWYDMASNRLISNASALTLTMVADTKIEARFSGDKTEVAHIADGISDSDTGTVTVWLQSEEAGSAGDAFLLNAKNGGDVVDSDNVKITPVISAVDGGSDKDIACYWQVRKSQLLTAVAPQGYQWEQLLSDGSSIRVSNSKEYTFVAFVDVKLVCVKDDGTTLSNGIFINEYATCLDSDADQTAADTKEFVGQVLLEGQEQLVACGVVLMKRDELSDVPQLDSADSQTIFASAWNGSTGQFAVEFPVANGEKYWARAYAVVYDRDASGTPTYVVRYSDLTASIV